MTNLQTQLTREQEEYEERLAMKDQEISDLRATIEEQSQEYADILEVKIKLDNEIATYRKLLETEEERQVVCRGRVQILKISSSIEDQC